ncbi:hypothetical protein M0805_004882 [Coniferiporia weirii]|nr:hypothetical protein M0805_004882 [Coniferiporia weirii]
MPPKASTASARPQHARKPSAVKTAPATDTAAAKDKTKPQPGDKGKDREAAAMPPPPPPPKPQAILEPEMGALEDSLKNATVTTAQIFKFYADTKRLDMQKYAPRPLHSMTSSLAYELSRYDQICDALESHLARAIAVLQRDLAREEDRLREEEAEKAREKAAQPVSIDVEMTNAVGLPGETDTKTRQSTPSSAVPGTGKPPLRRPSKISLSTLHRSPFPPKLDLSAAALRLGIDEMGLSMSALASMSALGGLGPLGSMGVGGIPGLSSPVTLAPKSARPMAQDEIPPEILAALASAAAGNQNTENQNQSQDQHGAIDLTLEEDLHASANMRMLGVGAPLGSSADKPIELDLDLDMSYLTSEIFGEQGDNGVQEQRQQPNVQMDVDDLFGSGPKSTEDMDMSILDALSGDQQTLFSSLNPESGKQDNASGTQQGDGVPGSTADIVDGSASFNYGELKMEEMGDFFNDMPHPLDIVNSNSGPITDAEGSGGGGESGALSNIAPGT